MEIAEFIKQCPHTSKLFETEKTMPKNMISTLMHRYSTRGNVGTGHRGDYPPLTYRALVAHRLVSQAFSEIGVTNGAISDREKIVKMVEDWMPTRLVFQFSKCKLEVGVPFIVKEELDKLKEPRQYGEPTRRKGWEG